MKSFSPNPDRNLLKIDPHLPLYVKALQQLHMLPLQLMP
jgi:hypothetical protein